MLALLSLAAALAQSVNVNVMPLRDVLPPQVMYYLSNPGQYFNITVQNPSTEAQQIFFGAELRQVTPASGLEVVVPAKTMPRQPIEVGAGATRVLTAAEVRTTTSILPESWLSHPGKNSVYRDCSIRTAIIKSRHRSTRCSRFQAARTADRRCLRGCAYKRGAPFPEMGMRRPSGDTAGKTALVPGRYSAVLSYARQAGMSSGVNSGQKTGALTACSVL